MNYRLNKFLSRTSYAADTTLVLDINIQDVISNISILYEITNAHADMDGHPAACIEKIELVDGSDVLFSLDGYETEALDWYNKGGTFGHNWNAALNGMDIRRVLNINFGRYLWDPELAFDPKQFNNPQLRITLDLASGGNSSSAVILTCWANLFETQPAGLKGFLMAKEFKQWTMADNTHEYTDLPNDYPYRALYHRAFLLGTESDQCVQNIKISEDQDKRIPYDCSGRDLMAHVNNAIQPLKKLIFILLQRVRALYTLRQLRWLLRASRIGPLFRLNWIVPFMMETAAAYILKQQRRAVMLL